MSKLSDLLLSSGFGNPWGDPSDDDDRTMQALHDAILEALFSGGVLPPDLLEKLFGDPADGDQEQMRAAARGADPADHRADEGVGLHHAVAGSRARAAAPRAGRRAGRGQRAGQVRGHRQGARLPRLPRAARSARLARAQQRRPARHARPVDRHRSQRRAQALRVRRHDEPRRDGDDPERGAARRRAAGGRAQGRRTPVASTSPTKI